MLRFLLLLLLYCVLLLVALEVIHSNFMNYKMIVTSMKCRGLGLVNIFKMYFSSCFLASGLFERGMERWARRAETFDSLAAQQHYVFPVSKSEHAKLMNCVLFGNALYGVWYIAFQVLFCLSQKSHCCRFCSALHFLSKWVWNAGLLYWRHANLAPIL